MRPITALLLLLLLPLLFHCSPTDPAKASLLGAVQIIAVLFFLFRGVMMFMRGLSRLGERHRP